MKAADKTDQTDESDESDEDDEDDDDDESDESDESDEDDEDDGRMNDYAVCPVSDYVRQRLRSKLGTQWPRGFSVVNLFDRSGG